MRTLVSILFLCLCQTASAEAFAAIHPRAAYTAPHESVRALADDRELLAQSKPDTVIVSPWSPTRRSDLVREVQRRLTDLGYEPGPVDGISGHRTTDAVKEYQQDNGLEPDGIVSEDLVELLRENSPSSPPSSTQ